MQDKEIPVLDEDRLAEEPASPAADEADLKSLTSQVTDLIEDVRILAHAEVEYYRAKLSVNMAATRHILLLFGIGVVVGIMAIIAVVLGLLMILSDYVGPVAATAIVTGSALLIATILVGMAITRAKRLPLDETDA